MTKVADRLHACCARVGFDLDRAGHALVDRMLLLAGGSGTFDDALRLASYAERVFAYYEEHKPAKRFDAVERRTVVLASLFSDLGKTGPAAADEAGRRAVVDAFAVENVTDDKQTLATFLRAHFPNDAAERERLFVAMGIDPSITVRQFWNLHSAWTLAIAEAAGLPPEAIAAAATHHLLDDVNPQAIVGDDDRYTRSFGTNTAFDRPEKLVILLDKYDAARRRGGRSHEGAIGWVRDRIAKNQRFRDDPELLELVADVDAALAST